MEFKVNDWEAFSNAVLEFAKTAGITIPTSVYKKNGDGYFLVKFDDEFIGRLNQMDDKKKDDFVKAISLFLV